MIRDMPSAAPVPAPHAAQETTWAIVTGEYPPQPGGVSDYTRQVAGALAEAGDRVYVFAPACEGVAPDDAGVTVHRLPGRFGANAIRDMGRVLAAMPGRPRILVQYVPQSLGWRGMNLGLCAWLVTRREEVWVMFHEVVFPLQRGQPARHTAYALATRAMAILLLRAAGRVFVSTPGWSRFTRPFSGARTPEAEWLPIPTNFVTPSPREEIEAVRAGYAEEMLLGHFGTYGARLRPILLDAIPALLRGAPERGFLLLGRGSTAFADEVRGAHPDVAERVHATGGLPEERMAAHLQACSLMVQPCEGGVTTRRGSVMASIALGVPVVSNDGEYTEPLWREAGAVALAPRETAEAVVAAVERVLARPGEQAALGRRGRDLYQAQFAVERIVQRLRCFEPAEPA